MNWIPILLEKMFGFTALRRIIRANGNNGMSEGIRLVAAKLHSVQCIHLYVSIFFYEVCGQCFRRAWESVLSVLLVRLKEHLIIADVPGLGGLE